MLVFIHKAAETILLTIPKMAALFDPRCYPPNEATPGTVRGAVNCANYLRSLDTQECFVPKAGVVMCTDSGTVVKGFTDGQESSSSYCRDVATAVVWILDHCPACGGDDCAIAGKYPVLP